MQQAITTIMQDTASYPHPVANIQLMETHISWVFLTGDYAYKIKKPVNLGFLDFSTLTKRHHYCEEELRLNRRMAADIYLSVVAILQQDGGYSLSETATEDDKVIDYAVKMKQFDPQAQLDRLLDANNITEQQIEQLAQVIARFHMTTAIAAADSSYGTPKAIHAPVLENFSQIADRLATHSHAEQLAKLRHWGQKTYHTLYRYFEQRKQQGYVRECHGDLHLRNIALYQQQLILFDCIEFDPALRWIDVMSDLAFTLMDLDDRNQPAFAWQLLDCYLQQTGDYAGLTGLRYYLCYRAMVRAKVEAIRATQAEVNNAIQQQAWQAFEIYLQLASSYTQPAQALLILTHGVSGSGKTYYTDRLLKQLGTIRIRSDVERKRLFQELSQQAQAVNQGLYATDITQKTYQHLHEMAKLTLQAGFTTIVDAAFLKTAQRAQFLELARQLGVSVIILSFYADETTLTTRIQRRQQQQHDASDATVEVLAHQLKTQQSLSEQERTCAITVNTQQGVDVAQLIEQLQQQQVQPV